jgi:hypothetical protein
MPNCRRVCIYIYVWKRGIIFIITIIIVVIINIKHVPSEALVSIIIRPICPRQGVQSLVMQQYHIY